MALELAICIGDQEEQTRLKGIVKKDTNTYIKHITQSRELWSLLKDGLLEPEDGKAEIDNEFNRIKVVVEQRLKNGVERPFKGTCSRGVYF